MEMSEALMIGKTQHWSGGNDILGIGLAYGLQCTKLTLEGRIAVDDPRHLHVNALVRKEHMKSISPARSCPTVTA